MIPLFGRDRFHRKNRYVVYLQNLVDKNKIQNGNMECSKRGLIVQIKWFHKWRVRVSDLGRTEASVNVSC